MSDSSTATTDSAVADSRLDTPLVTLRPPRVEAQEDNPPMQEDPLEASLNTPLPALRSTSTSGDDRDDYLVFKDPESPALTEIVDEDEDEDVLEYVLSSDKDAERAISSTVEVIAAEPAPTDSEDTPLPPPSSARSMVNQTIRSFETRSRKSKEASSDESSTPVASTTPPAGGLSAATLPPATTPAKKKATKAASRSLSSLSASDAAPADSELYRLANLVPPPKKEAAGDHRIRLDENVGRTIVWILSLQKVVEDNNKAQIAQNKEILRRLSDLQLASSSPSSSLNLNTTADISRLKQLMAEGRESLSKVTQCVNGLVDLPIELAGLKRSIQTIANQSSTHTPSSHPPQPPPASETQTAVPDTHRAKGSTGTKRIQRAFSPVAEPEAKRAKTVDDAFWFDVYMWDVKPQFGSAYQIGRAALEALKMSTDAYLSAMHLNGLPKTLVSLRFSDAEVARMFIERMRGNPPKGMEHLEVATAASYGKRKEGNSGNVTRKPKESKFW